MIAAVWMAAAASAAAEPKITVHAAGTASGGYTDNVLSAPDDPAPGDDPREGDVFTELAPAVLVVVDTPRTFNEIGYGVRLLRFADSDAGNSLNHQGNWRGLFLLSPLSQLRTSATVRAGQSSALATDGALAGVLPFGESSFISAAVDEVFARRLDREWSVEQTAVASIQSASGGGIETRGVETGAGGGVRRTFRNTEIGASAGARYIDLDRDTAAEIFNQQAVIGDVRASVGRDLGRRWTVRGELGGRFLAALDGSFDPRFGPVALISASYIERIGELSTTAEHTLAPNLLVARHAVTDRLVLRGRLPMWRDIDDRARLSLSGSIGYQRVKALALADLATEAITDALIGDLGAAVAPTPDLTVSLRYQYRRQEADLGLADAVPSFDRSTVILSLNGVYPRREVEERKLRSNRIDEREQVLEERE